MTKIYLWRKGNVVDYEIIRDNAVGDGGGVREVGNLERACDLYGLLKREEGAKIIFQRVAHIVSPSVIKK